LIIETGRVALAPPQARRWRQSVPCLAALARRRIATE